MSEDMNPPTKTSNSNMKSIAGNDRNSKQIIIVRPLKILSTSLSGTRRRKIQTNG
jgi:hypothetical protein